MLTASAIVLFRFVRTRSTAAATVSMLALAAMPVILGACESAPTASEQPWSSRSQSVQATGDAKLSDSGRPTVAPLPVPCSPCRQLRVHAATGRRKGRSRGVLAATKRILC
jgi:hypothetical protein